jgi:ParB family chromosome partitioning protein
MIEILEINKIPLELIDPPDTKIRDIDPSTLADLKESIKQFGVLQPILVRPRENTTHYQVIFGYHRFLAAKGVGLTEIPAQIKNVNRETALLMAVTENIHRLEMNPLKEGELYERLIGYYGGKELSRLLGKSEVYIKGRLDLYQKLHPDLRIEIGKRLTLGLAIRLSTVWPPNQQLKVFDEIEKSKKIIETKYVPRGHKSCGTHFGKAYNHICTCDRCGAVHVRGVDTTKYDEPKTELPPL